MSHAGSDDDDGAPRTGAYLRTKLRVLDAALVETARRVLASAELRPQGGRQPEGPKTDDEALHDMRVTIRRIRTVLKMSRRLFGRWHANVVRAAFAAVMRATGQLRDEEVLEETLEGAANAAGYAAWLQRRKTREAKLRRGVVLRLERGDLDRARLLLKALLVFPVEPRRNVDLARFARRTVERARTRVERRRDVDVADADALHALRIAYKELRYSIELLEDALPIDARAQLEPAIVFQKRLGELHDVDVAIEVVGKARGLSAAAREEALGTLAALREKRVHKYLRELDPLHASHSGPRSAPRSGRPNGAMRGRPPEEPAN